MRAEPVAGGRLSCTEFVRVAVSDERAVVQAIPLTGRTHQIRIHLAAGGTPILGDTLYGRPYVAGAPWSAERLQLHAASVTLAIMPGACLKQTLTAPLPADWEGAPRKR